LKTCLPSVSIIGSPVTALPYEEQIQIMAEWAKERLSKVVCVANVHMITEAHWHSELELLLKYADMVTPDGMPLVWMMQLMGIRKQDRVAGLDVLLGLCKSAERDGTGVYFVGSLPEILESIQEKLLKEFPNLIISGLEPLPFRPLTQDEDEALVEKINQSNAGVVFVSLGCPKQEFWMGAHRDRINAVMVGLGGAFPVYAGIHKRAPRWVRDIGMEWLYRLIQEPRRLWYRYGSTIPPFIFLALKQLLTQPKANSTRTKDASSDSSKPGADVLGQQNS
jgi:N-acetylglucosaminyldiphosphoundecaprenol N-acetyl-beta-D-mannosaminyltransferase